MITWTKRLVITITLLALIATNILTLTNTAFNAALSGLMGISTSFAGNGIVAGYLNYQKRPDLRFRQGQVHRTLDLSLNHAHQYQRHNSESHVLQRRSQGNMTSS